MMPVGAKRNDGVVEFYADTPAHAHHHRLAVHHIQAPLEMLHQVGGDQSNPFLRANQCLELRPPGLEPLLVVDLLALGRFFEFLVQFGPLGIVQFQFGQPAFIVDRHRGAVLHRPLDIVDADVVAKDGARVLVCQLDRRAGEADKRRIGQRRAHVPGKAVDEVIWVHL